MIKYFFLLLICSGVFASEAFIITYKGSKVYIENQAKKNEFAGLIVKNETFKRLIGQVQNEDSVIRRVTIKPGQSKSFQIKHNEYKKLYYLNLSPASETIALIIGKEDYEIPKKK